MAPTFKIPTPCLLLLSGVPATGKSTFARYLASSYAFAHYDLEHPHTWPHPELKVTWDDSRPEFVTRLQRLHERVVLDWGFPPRVVSWVRELRNAGVKLVWFGAHVAHARTLFLQRGGIPVQCFDAQMADIVAMAFPAGLDATVIQALTDAGEAARAVADRARALRKSVGTHSRPATLRSMARRTSPERVQEFRVYVAFARAMQSFLEKLHAGTWKDTLPDGTSYFERMSAEAERLLTEGRAPSQWVTGWKQATADMLEMTRGLDPKGVAEADKFLVKRGAVSLSEMRRRVWRVIPKVLKRGAIRTIDEFYVLKNVLDDDGEDLTDDERARLETMRFDFETRAAPTRKTPAANRTSRGRPQRATSSSPKQSARVPSPSGWCEAYVVEWSDDNRQVILEFDGGACGSGAVSAFGKAPDLRLRWLDPTTVEVQHAANVRIDRNASGEIIQCGGPHRRVRVVLKPV